MAEANQSRRAFAPRAADSRTALAAHISLAQQAGDLFESTQRAGFLPGSGNTKHIEKSANEAWSNLYLHAMTILPQDRQDLLLLAAHTAIMADQLEDRATPGDAYEGALFKGIEMALEAITDFLAREIGTDGIEIVSPELASQTRIIVNIVSDRRQPAEGR